MYACLLVGLLSLGLADNCVRDEGASSLADLLRQTGYLQRLLLSGNEVADEGGSKLVAALTQNTSLKALYLARVCLYLRCHHPCRHPFLAPINFHIPISPLPIPYLACTTYCTLPKLVY
jgi:hypothetical protein